MRRGQFVAYKASALRLRKRGKSYGEIRSELNARIPKSTLSLWCADATFTQAQLNKIEQRMRRGGEIGRAAAIALNRERRDRYFKSLFHANEPLRRKIFASKKSAKLVLATLYLAEGSKGQKARLMFGNSNPGIIRLFMDLMRFVYEIDESKLRCTVQCRADQDTRSLEMFWSKVTAIPRSRFYKARVDPRSIGVPSLKKDYRAVCRIDYFSSSVYNDLLVAGRVILDERGP